MAGKGKGEGREMAGKGRGEGRGWQGRGRGREKGGGRSKEIMMEEVRGEERWEGRKGGEI